jgi:hypothetical protein
MLLSYYCDDRIGRSSDGNSSKKSALGDSGVYEFALGAGSFGRVRIRLPSKASRGAGIQDGALSMQQKSRQLAAAGFPPPCPKFPRLATTSVKSAAMETTPVKRTMHCRR